MERPRQSHLTSSGWWEVNSEWPECLSVISYILQRWDSGLARGLCQWAWQPESRPWDSHGGKREWTPGTYIFWVPMCVKTQPSPLFPDHKWDIRKSNTLGPFSFSPLLLLYQPLVHLASSWISEHNCLCLDLLFVLGFFFCILFYFIWDKISPCGSGWPGTQSSWEHWNYTHAVGPCSKIYWLTKQSNSGFRVQ